MKILCACGCGEYFEKTANRMTVKPDHRHEYRLRMARERQTRYRKLRHEYRRKNGCQQKNAGRVLCDVKCPADGEIYQMPFDSPPSVMPRIYCHKHSGNRERTADNATMYMDW